MHSLIARLVEQHLNGETSSDTLLPFMRALSDALASYDQEHQLLKQSLTHSSEKLNFINDTLRQQLLENQTAKKQVEENLAKQKALLDTIPEVVYSFRPGGSLSLANRAGLELLNIDRETLYAQNAEENLEMWFRLLANPNSFKRELEKISRDHKLELHGYFEMLDGRVFEFSSVPETLGDQYLGRVWCCRDITETKRHEEKLRHLAFHDALTSLPNRVFLLESIFHAINLAKRNRTQVAVMFIDLDDFKKINDTAGHEVGDMFLIEVSRKIHQALRQGDILGRLGGDEFLILLEGIQKQQEITAVKERVLEMLSEAIVVGDKEYVVTCSIGLSLYPNDGDHADELVRKADMAMYHAKQSGKNTFRYFDVGLEKIALHRLSIETQLRTAIANLNFILVFQPKVELSSGDIVAVEALIRWVKPDGEVIFPDKFIGTAENTGFINTITRWVIATACKKIQSWRGSVLQSLSISVNISALDFRDDSFPSYVEHTLSEYGIEPGQMEFELTESVFLEEKSRAKAIIADFKRMGLELSIDDFGTGYSSFRYLQDLDIDCLKIDRSFVSNVSNHRSAAIVKSIVDVGKNLGMCVVAEGVENEEELTLVRDVGCDMCQGYYFSRPISEEALVELVNSHGESSSTSAKT